jgi:hypothetical protein
MPDFSNAISSIVFHCVGQAILQVLRIFAVVDRRAAAITASHADSVHN